MVVWVYSPTADADVQIACLCINGDCCCHRYPHRPRLLRAVALERFNLFAVFLYLPRPAVMAQARWGWGWAAQLG